MTTFFAKYGKQLFNGGWQQCIAWARELVQEEPAAVVKILRQRAGEKYSRVVAEIAADHEYLIRNGRVMGAKRGG